MIMVVTTPSFWAAKSHWDFLCSDCSNFNLMRWWILVIVTFLGNNSDKLTYIIKLTWEITWCVIYLIKVNHTLYNDILYKTTWTSLFFMPRWQHWAAPSLLYSLVLGIYNFDIHMHPGWTLHWLVVHNSIACPLNIQGFLYFRNLTTTTYILLHRIVYNQESLPIESFLWSHVEKFQR